VVAAILSSTVDIPLENKCCFAGEVGLSGEVRPVGRIEQRLLEAEKLGFKTCYISLYNKKSVSHRNHQMKIIEINRIQELTRHLFG
jgi:DNA repair protein RadA/Sms